MIDYWLHCLWLCMRWRTKCNSRLILENGGHDISAVNHSSEVVEHKIREQNSLDDQRADDDKSWNVSWAARAHELTSATNLCWLTTKKMTWQLLTFIEDCKLCKILKLIIKFRLDFCDVRNVEIERSVSKRLGNTMTSESFDRILGREETQLF